MGFFGLSITSGISCHSASFLTDCGLLLALSVKSLETAPVGIGRTKAANCLGFSAGLCSSVWGQRAGLLLISGAPRVAAMRADPTARSHVARVMWGAAETIGTAGTTAFSGPQGKHENNKLTLNLAELYGSEDIQHIAAALGQWTRNFQGWFIQLLLSKHQAPGSLPANHSAVHTTLQLFQGCLSHPNYADQHFLVILRFSLFIHAFLWYIIYLHRTSVEEVRYQSL